ncbi:MAG: sterol desaturase family protein [Pseudomonadota bacterium]
MSDTPQSRFEKQWHYRPETPISTSPLFQWPPHPTAILRWFANRWLTFGENLILVALATLTWWYFHPSLETTKTLDFNWIAGMFLRNAALITAVAGGLHLLLHVKRSQKDQLKFDPRDIRHKGRVFTFKNQTHDNMFWTLTSGVFFWTGFEVVMFWGMANGYVPILWWAENPVWLIAMFLLTPLWISFHFYWIHRALHWSPLYKIAHKLHHRNTNIGPWSGLSMHPIEHLMFFSSVLLHWMIAAHPVLILFHMQHQALTAATSHAGFDALLIKDKRSLELGNFHHQMHHRYFECNYGSLEVPWDKVFGSYHDGSEASHQTFLTRRKALMDQAQKTIHS